MYYSDVLKNAYEKRGKHEYLPELMKIKNYTTPCFFSRNELDMVIQGQTKNAVKAAGEYSHLKFYKKMGKLGFLDYSSRPVKFYENLEDWMTEHEISFNDVFYGYQKFDGKNDFVHLKTVFDSICLKNEIEEHNDQQKDLEYSVIDEDSETSPSDEEDVNTRNVKKRKYISEFIDRFSGLSFNGNPIFTGNVKFTIRY
jgi:hypothetical protein